MYVNRLIEFADSHPQELPTVGFKEKKVHWIFYIEEESFAPVYVKNRKLIVPDIARSSGIKPILLVDKADYVLGISDTSELEKRSKERHEAYLELLQSYLDFNDDRDIETLYKILQSSPDLADHKVKMDDVIAFCIRGDEFLHENQRVRKFWSKQVQPVRDAKSVDELTCMFCGESGSVLDRHTISFLIGPDRTKLISANENAYESHGLKNSYSAPTCYVCEQKYGQALEYLLARHKGNEPGGPHMFRIGDLTYVYWMRGEKQISSILSIALAPDKHQSKDDIKDIIIQAFKGVSIKRNLNNFCLLTLSANKGRLVVRDYVENSAGHLKERIECFFEAQDVGIERYYGIYTLAATMYTEATTQMQKYALKEWLDWLLHGRPLSGRILIPLLKQIQVGGTMHAHYAAAVKSWLVSQRGKQDIGRGGRSMTEDKDRNTPAYIMGRLFAVLEKIQQEAINPQSTIAAKFFGSASTAPRSVMGMLIRNAQHHLVKIRNDKEWRARILDERLAMILGKVNEYPTILDLSGQAEFALGYYHEKQYLFTSKKTKEKGDEVSGL